MKDQTALHHKTTRQARHGAAHRCTVFVFGVALLGFSQLADANQDRELALGALQRLDYDGAAAILTYLADEGDPRGQAALGTLLESGRVATDYPLPPIELLRKAANQGVPQAALELGNRNYLGRASAQDLGQAVQWWRIAAENGSIPADFNLGLAYAKGSGAVADLEKAEQWFTGAADSGSLHARFALGVLQLDAAEFDTAFANFELAANAGLASAQFNLASMYEQGIGVERDPEQAIHWYRQAARADVDGASAALARLGGIREPENELTNSINDSAWVLSQSADHYTLQVATGGSDSAILKILERYTAKIVRANYYVNETDNPRYLALVGSFPSYLDAIAFLNSLKPELRVYNPWIRRFGSIQALAGDRDGS